MRRATLAAVVVALAIPGAAAATFPGANGKLAYLREEDAGRMLEVDLYVAERDGITQTNVTADVRGLAWSPAWSPDGERLAFFLEVSGTDWWLEWSDEVPVWALMVANGDGSAKRAVTSFRGGFPSVAWAPDGARLVYDRPTGRSTNLFEIRVDGTAERQLTRLNGFAHDANWSPDGARIAFIAAPRGRYAEQVSVLSLADGAVTRIGLDFPYSVDWSPDGTRLLVDRLGGLFTVRPDGSERVRLLPDEFDEEHGARWSPDGTKIVLATARVRPEGLALVNADGSCLARIPVAANAFEPSWQPTQPAVPTGPLTCVDLTVETSKGTRAAEARSSFPLNVSVRNRGNLPSGGSTVVITASAEGERDRGLSVVYPGCSGRGVVRCTLGAVGPGETRRLRPSLTPTRVGELHVDVRVEAPGDVDVSNDRDWTEIMSCSRLGTSGPDRLVGTARRDVFCGLEGADRIDGRGGRDLVFGGAGDDLLQLGGGRDEVDAGAGADTVFGGAGGDVVAGGPGADRVHGGDGGDALAGGRGNDRISGGPGPDEIAGDKGNDRLLGEDGEDWIDAWDGARDRVDGGPGRDRASHDRVDTVESAFRSDFTLGFPGIAPAPRSIEPPRSSSQSLLERLSALSRSSPEAFSAAGRG